MLLGANLRGKGVDGPAPAAGAAFEPFEFSTVQLGTAAAERTRYDGAE